MTGLHLQRAPPTHRGEERLRSVARPRPAQLQEKELVSCSQEGMKVDGRAEKKEPIKKRVLSLT